jgi:hypothetical protein
MKALTQERLNEIHENYRKQWQPIYDKIIDCLNNDGVVIISTYYHATEYHKKHIDKFKIGWDGALYTLHGKQWLDITNCAITCYNKDKK